METTTKYYYAQFRDCQVLGNCICTTKSNITLLIQHCLSFSTSWKWQGLVRNQTTSGSSTVLSKSTTGRSYGSHCRLIDISAADDSLQLWRFGSLLILAPLRPCRLLMSMSLK